MGHLNILCCFPNELVNKNNDNNDNLKIENEILIDLTPC